MEPVDTNGAWNGQGKGTSLGNRIFIALIRLFGPQGAYLLLLLVAAIYTLHDQTGRVVIKAFRTRLGLKTGFSGYWRHYFTFGMLLIDRMAFLLCKKVPFTFTCINENQINELLAEGNGLLMVSAHIGSWDISGNLLKDRLNAPMNALMLDNERDDLKAVFSDAESNRRFKVIALSKDPLTMMVPVLNALKAGEIVSFLADRVVKGSPAVSVDFFGKKVGLAAGPFQIAAITGAPILPVFTVKTGLFSYQLRAAEPIRILIEKRGEREKKIAEAAQCFADELARETRAFPAQWGNFYDLWEAEEKRRTESSSKGTI